MFNFEEKAGDGKEAYDAVQDVKEIREVHAAFMKWLCANMEPRGDGGFTAEMSAAGDGVIVRTPAGPVISDLEFVRDADGTAGLVVFYQPERKHFHCPPRAIFAIRLTANFEISSGTKGGHKWDYRDDKRGWAPTEAVKLGYELLLGQLTPRG